MPQSLFVMQVFLVGGLSLFMKFVFEWVYGRRPQSVIKLLSCKYELIILFKLLTTKNFILLKNDKIYQTTKFFKQRKIDLVLSGRTGTKLNIFQLFVKIVMFYYIFIIFKRQKK